MSWITKRTINFIKNLTNSATSDSDIIVTKRQDTLAKEIPVALVYNDIAHTVMMCSPRDLEDFAMGFSLTEGIIDKPADIYGIDIEEVCNGMEARIELATRCFVALKDHRRTLTGRTGCGICGAEQIQQVYKNVAKLDRTLTFNICQFDTCLQQLYEAQELGKQTGSTHAAAFFSVEGKLLAIREDVGRHVALDKLLGWHAKADTPQGFIVVTSRASYEMVQKTVSCGIEMLIAISAATDLAVQMAEQYNLTLVGFAREGRAPIYSGKERLLTPLP